ncbi:MAG: LysR family transcriptional regulator [Chloroflexota bacterium]|nr:LysR family transcriptional regulator [Chloroflexota bacterium]
MPLELRDLRYFLVVAEECQITRAAARLHVSQPTLSQAMERLERNVGASLLVRHPGGVGLTVAGELFVSKATACLAAVDDAVAAVTTNTPEPLAIGFLPPVHAATGAAVSAFRDRHRDVDVRWVALDYAGQLSRLRNSSVDVAFLWAPYDDVDIDFAAVVSEARVVLIARDHPLAAKRRLTYADLCDMRDPHSWAGEGHALLDPCYLTDTAGYGRRHARRPPATMGETWARVASGHALALVPASVAEAHASAGVVWRSLVDVPPAVLALAWRRADRRAEIRDLVRLAAFSGRAR